MAARIKALVEPAMLVWARKTASLTQEEAALALEVPLERLQAWEKEGNDETPTVNQLKRMAERYKRPLSVFYLAAPPNDFQPLRDFRRLPGTVDHRFSAQLAYEVRAAYERRQIAIEVTQRLDQEPVLFGITARQTDDPEQVGRRNITRAPLRKLTGRKKVPQESRSAIFFYEPAFTHTMMRGLVAAILGQVAVLSLIKVIGILRGPQYPITSTSFWLHSPLHAAPVQSRRITRMAFSAVPGGPAGPSAP
jgi:transcriptional regulator with XRE-family HTH domain